MRKRNRTIAIKSIGLPCIKSSFYGEQLMKFMQEFYADPVNEAAFQRWLKERRKEA